MVQQVLHREIPFIGIPQFGDELGYLAIQRELPLVVRLHDRQQRAHRLGGRGQVVHRREPDRLPMAIIEITERLVVHHEAVFRHQHLATRKSLLLQSFPHDRLDHVQPALIRPDLFRLVIAQTALLRKDTRTGIIHARDGDRQLPFRPDATKDSLRGVFLRQGRVLVRQDHRPGGLDRALEILASVRQGKERVNELFLLGQSTQRLALRDTHRVHAAYNHVVVPQLMNGGNNNANQLSSRLRMSGSYLRLKSIMVGYTLPKKQCEKIFLSSLRIYASIDNAWTWCAKDFRGYDPESGLSAIQTSNYPVPINYSIGLNVGF